LSIALEGYVTKFVQDEDFTIIINDYFKLYNPKLTSRSYHPRGYSLDIEGFIGGRGAQGEAQQRKAMKKV